MLAALLFPPIASLAALLVSVFVALMAPKGRGAIAGAGCMLVFLGLGFLAIGKIVPRWGGGPPLEGSMATFGSLFMIVFGGCIILVVFLKQSGDDTHGG